MVKFAIHGLPRSGSTWLGEIINSSPHVAYRYQPLFSYAFKGALNEFSTNEDIQQFYRALANSEDSFLLQSESRAKGKLPTVVKDRTTHVGYKEVRYHHLLPHLVEVSKDVKFIFIQRNPLSVVNSWLNAPREFRADLGWNPLEEWRYACKKNLDRPEEFNGYEKWKQASLLFNALGREFSGKVKLVRYDSLIENVVEETKSIYDFLELGYHPNAQEFIMNSNLDSSSDAYSVMRTNQSDDKWKTGLAPEIINDIRLDLEGSELEELL